MTVAYLEPNIDRLFVVARSLPHAVNQLAGEQIDRLVLDVVVLHGQGLICLDVQDLANVVVGVRPNRLVSPWLGYGFHGFAAAHGVSVVLEDWGIYC